jgi:hypothetical protein
MDPGGLVRLGVVLYPLLIALFEPIRLTAPADVAGVGHRGTRDGFRLLSGNRPTNSSTPDPA